MDTHQALLTRRTIHNFSSTSVDPSAIGRALHAAHHAPCHRLTWPWIFHLIGPETRRALCEIAIGEKQRRAELSEAQRDANRRAWSAPPVLIVVSSRRDPRPDVDDENYAASCVAVQNLMLSLHADGVGSKWSTGGAMHSADAHPLLGLTPDEHRLVGQVWVGHAAATPTINRPPLEEHLRRWP